MHQKQELTFIFQNKSMAASSNKTDAWSMQENLVTLKVKNSWAHIDWYNRSSEMSKDSKHIISIFFRARNFSVIKNNLNREQRAPDFHRSYINFNAKCRLTDQKVPWIVFSIRITNGKVYYQFLQFFGSNRNTWPQS